MLLLENFELYTWLVLDGADQENTAYMTHYLLWPRLCKATC